MNGSELFTVSVRFHQVPYETEFLRSTGQVWCRTSPNGATKTNGPMAGIHDTIMNSEIVDLCEIDASHLGQEQPKTKEFLSDKKANEPTTD